MLEKNEALLQAACDGDVFKVKSLLEQGADINAKDKNGRTALILATEKGYVEIVKVLLEHGADVNAIDKNCNVPLSLAKEKGHSEIAQLLKQAGARTYTESLIQPIKKILTQPKEKILLLTGIATLLELLCPPWIFKAKGYENFLGFHPIWETNIGGYCYTTIDYSLLIIEVIVTIFVGLSIYLYLLVKSQKEKTR